MTRRVAGLSVALLVLLVVSGGLVGPLRAAGSLASFESSPRPVETLADPGPHAVVALEVEVPRTRGGDGTFRARVLVPLPVPGGPAAPLPALAFGHGYLASVDWYESTLAHLASWGIVVIAPRSASELFPDHSAFADDLLSALDWVERASRADAAWPGGPVDPGALGLSGHSMGGGVALLAAAREPGVRAVATLAAVETDPSAIEAAGTITASALFLAAADDAITPVSEHQRPMYEAKASGPAQLREIGGAGHCGFLDLETVILGLVCDEAAIGPEEQRRITREVLGAWLRYELAGDEAMEALAWPDASDGATLVERRS
jgi:dienelactone hydrolase